MDLTYFCHDQSIERTAVETEQEAESLKQRRWDAACRLGICRLLVHLARHLGHDPASINDAGGKEYYYSECGPKRRLRISPDGVVTTVKADAEVTIYWDGYGRFTTVWAGGQQVYSSHECESFIVPGPWLELALKLENQANTEAAIQNAQDQATKLSRALTLL